MGGPFFHLADFYEILIFLFVFLGPQLARLLLPRPPCIRHAKEEAEAEEEAQDAAGRGKIIRQSLKTLRQKKTSLCHNLAQHLPQSICRLLMLQIAAALALTVAALKSCGYGQGKPVCMVRRAKQED